MSRTKADLKMKQETKFDNIQNAVRFLEAEKEKLWDTEVNYNDLVVCPVREGLTIYPKHGIETYPLNDNAARQLSARVGIPYRYYEQLETLGNYQLLADNINFLIGKHAEKGNTALLRMRENTVRAVMTPSYLPLDNVEVFSRIAETINGSFSTSGYLSDTHLHITFTSKNVCATIGELKAGEVGDEVRAGFVITNSETGNSALNLAARIWRLVCANGMITNRQEVNFHQVHRGKDGFNSVWDDFKKSAVNMVDSFQPEVDKLVMSALLNFDHVQSVLHGLGKQEFNLTKKQINQVKDAYELEPVPTKWGVINAFTRAGQNERLFTNRLQFEKWGGRINGMSIDRLKRHDVPASL